MTLTRLSFLACTAVLAAPMALAHEFWIEPPAFQVQKEEPFVADLRNGQLFEGTRQSFFADRNTRLEVVMGDDVAAIDGRMGDRPAIQLPAPARDGLMILAHEAAFQLQPRGSRQRPQQRHIGPATVGDLDQRSEGVETPP